MAVQRQWDVLISRIAYWTDRGVPEHEINEVLESHPAVWQYLRSGCMPAEHEDEAGAAADALCIVAVVAGWEHEPEHV